MKRLILAMAILFIVSGQSPAAPWNLLDTPDSQVAANSAVDLVWDGQYLWVGTGKGLSGTSDSGRTWISYNSSNGLSANEISAVTYDGSRLWIAASHLIVSNSQQIPIGDGINFTSNHGQTFELDTPFQATSPGMIAYDLSAHDSAIFAACFYGGLIYSLDTGKTWQNLFPDTIAQNDFTNKDYQDYNNRFFTVKVDANYFDTVVVWGGTAEGINQFQYIGRHAKLASNWITDLGHTPSYTWIATEGGLSRTGNRGLSYRSFFRSDGLTSDHISTIATWADNYVISAGYDPETDSATGFAFSADNGDAWNQSYPAEAVGEGNKVEDMVITQGESSEKIIWAACSRGGLIRSLDNGLTWEKIQPDPGMTSPDSLFNQIFSVDYFYSPGTEWPCDEQDTLSIFAGCGIGFWLLKLPCPFTGIESATLFRIDSLEQAGRKVVDIKANMWTNTEQTDTTIEWALATWQSEEGAGANTILLSKDYGQTWVATLANKKCHQLIYVDSSIWAATGNGLERYSRPQQAWIRVGINDFDKLISLDTSLTTISFDPLRDSLWVGSIDGVANSVNALFWDIDTVNLDPTKFDYNVRSISDTLGLSGEFITAMGIQYREGERIVWAAAQSTGVSGQYNAINISRDNGIHWEAVLTGVDAWNFAFDDSNAYVASSSGLLQTPDFGETWDTLRIIDSSRGIEIYPGVEFLGVAIVNGALWFTSDDGIAKGENLGTSWTVYRTFEQIPDESGATAFASPVPSSPTLTPGGHVKFHYKFQRTGSVTISVYDFAMNLVATPVENLEREGGLQHDADSWNMHNDNGDAAAAGVYYFKVENSSGEEAWGKIMVIP